MKTLLPSQITDADRPFVCSRANADGTVTLYYPGDVIPPMPTPTPAEIAAHEAAQKKDDADAQAAKAYNRLKQLMQMTPDEVRAWVAANVTNLAQAQDAIATLAIAVGVLARRL